MKDWSEPLRDVWNESLERQGNVTPPPRWVELRPLVRIYSVPYGAKNLLIYSNFGPCVQVYTSNSLWVRSPCCGGDFKHEGHEEWTCELCFMVHFRPLSTNLCRDINDLESILEPMVDVAMDPLLHAFMLQQFIHVVADKVDQGRQYEHIVELVLPG